MELKLEGARRINNLNHLNLVFEWIIDLTLTVYLLILVPHISITQLPHCGGFVGILLGELDC